MLLNKRKFLSSFLFLTSLSSASSPYFGTIIDENSIPVENARIVVQSTGDTLFTDSDGKFGDWKSTSLKLLNNTRRSLTQPTLFRNSLYLEADRAGVAYSAAVMNLRGQILWEQSGTASAPGIMSLPCKHTFAKGIYLLHTVVGGVEMVTKTNNMNRPGIKTDTPAKNIATAAVTRADVTGTVDTLFVSAQSHIRTAVEVVNSDTPHSIVVNSIENSFTLTPAVESVTVATNTTLLLSATAEDVSGDLLSLLWSDKGSDFDTLQVDSSYSVTYSDPGEKWIYIKALNEYDELSLPDSIHVSVYEPTITLEAPATLAITEDGMLPILLSQCTITDNNGTGPYTLQITEPAVEVPYTIIGTDTLVPAADFNGELAISVTVTDGVVMSNSETITVTVTAVNDIPSFTLKQDSIVVSEESDIVLNTILTSLYSGADNENQVVSLTAELLSGSDLFVEGKAPAITSDTVLSFSTKQNVKGSATVALFANDGEINSDTSVFTILVNDSNYVPALREVYDTVRVSEGTDTVLTLVGSDIDGTAPLLTMGTLPSVLSFTEDSLLTFSADFTTLSHGETKEYVANYKLVDAEDPSIALDYSTVFILSNLNRTPELREHLDTVLVFEGVDSVLTLVGTDADNMVPVVTMGTLPSVLSFEEDSLLTFSADYATLSQGETQEYSVKYTLVDAEDPALSVEYTTVFVLSNVNRAPVITSIPDTSVGTRNSIDVTVDISDLDGDELTVTSNYGTFKQVSQTIFRFSPSRFRYPGDLLPVKLYISDGEDTTEHTWNIAITDHEWNHVVTEDDISGIVAPYEYSCYAIYKSQAGSAIVKGYKKDGGIDGRFSFQLPFEGTGVLVDDAHVYGKTLKDIFIKYKDSSGKIGWLQQYAGLNRLNDTITTDATSAYIVDNGSRGTREWYTFDGTTGKLITDAGETTTKTWMGTPLDMEVATESGWQFISVDNGDLSGIYYRTGSAFRRISTTYASGHGYSVSNMYTDIDIREQDGTEVWAIREDGVLCSWDGNTTNGGFRFYPRGGLTPGNLKKVIALENDDTNFFNNLWVLDTNGNLYFLSKNDSSVQYKENFDGAAVRDIVKSADGKSVWVLTEDGKIYSYFE